MKTKEELNALKEEVETVNEKLNELTPEELETVNGGVVHDIRQGPVARQLGNMDDACYVQMHPTCIPCHGDVNIN